MSDATHPANLGETRSFPTVGADRVADTLVAVARLSADGQARIAAAARETAAICFTPDPAAGRRGDRRAARTCKLH